MDQFSGNIEMQTLSKKKHQRAMIITIATPNIVPFVRRYLEQIANYAFAQQMDFCSYQSTILADRLPVFSKIPVIQEQLQNERNDYVIWVDADVLFTNLNRNIIDELPSHCWIGGVKKIDGQINAGLMVIRNCEKAKSTFKKIQLLADELVEKWQLPYEEILINKVIDSKSSEDVFRADADSFGTFSTPGAWHNIRMWQPGDLTIHVAGKSLEYKKNFVDQYFANNST